MLPRFQSTEASNAARFKSTQLVSVESVANGARLFTNLRRVPQAKSKNRSMPVGRVYEICRAGLDCESDIRADRVFSLRVCFG